MSTPDIHPIEEESYRILAGRIDLSQWAPGPAAVIARVVHATADPALVGNLVVPEEAVAAGVAALRSGAPVLCDVEMVRVGISGIRAQCHLSDVVDPGEHSSRSAAGMALAAEKSPTGAIVVVGCAPTALEVVCTMIDRGDLNPALVVGVPVGYVGAADAKEKLLRLARSKGTQAIVLRGERGGAAIAVAIVNSLSRLAGVPPIAKEPRSTQEGMTHRVGGLDSASAAAGTSRTDPPALLLIGHGTRSSAGEAELRSFCRSVAEARPDTLVEAGFIEFVSPTIDQAIATLAKRGARQVVGVPLVLLPAGHMKDDGPAALARARLEHPDMTFSYGRDLGVHPQVLSTVEDRVRESMESFTKLGADSAGTNKGAVVLVGRGSTDPDANAELARAARLLAEGRSIGLVEPAYVSLATPDVQEALERCMLLGAKSIAVVPYFLFDGILVERIALQASDWAQRHPEIEVVIGKQMGVDPRIVELTWERYDESASGPVSMNCDCCVYRVPLPGFEDRVGQPPFANTP